jgi:hypothetical protein
MERAAGVVVFVLTCGCGDNLGGTGDPSGGEPFVAPRIVAVGSGQLEYDAHGHFVGFVDLDGDLPEWELTWAGDQLARVRGPGIYGRVSYRGDQIVGYLGDNPFDTMTLEYDADGRLARRSRTRRDYRGDQHTQTYEYTYDGWGRLGWIHYAEDPPGVAAERTEEVSYGQNGCPELLRGQQFVYDEEGRLAEVDFNPVRYDDDRRMSAIGDIPIAYDDGPAADINLVPGAYAGGYAWSLIEDGYMFRLDGRCDPSLDTQEKVMSLFFSHWPALPEIPGS